jgi:hypothetical protein
LRFEVRAREAVRSPGFGARLWDSAASTSLHDNPRSLLGKMMHPSYMFISDNRWRTDER